MQIFNSKLCNLFNETTTKRNVRLWQDKYIQSVIASVFWHGIEPINQKGDDFFMPQKHYFCTRPSLASILLDAGFQGRQTANPYHPERPAWSFDLSTSLAFTVAEYYQEIGKAAPKVITDLLKAAAPTTAEASDLL